MDDKPQATVSVEDDVPLRFAKALLVQARAFGKDVDEILASARFPFNPLTDDVSQWSHISVRDYSRLCMVLFESLEDESGGIVQGMQTPMGSTRMLTYATIHCRNLQEVMRRAIDFNAACREREGRVKVHQLEVDGDEKTATLHYLSHDEEELIGQDGVLCSMAIWLRVCAWMIGKNIEILSAGCAGPAPENRAGIHHFFPCPVEFDQKANWLSFSAPLLDAPIVRSEGELEDFLKVAPYHVVIKPVVNEQSITEHIRTIIGDDFRLEMPSFEQLTNLLNMSARTLRRRLEKEGTSYQRIKDSARRDAAIAFLNNPQLTVGDVAELVGFSDPSAFHRSFKRWTGVSPGEYR